MTKRRVLKQLIFLKIGLMNDKFIFNWILKNKLGIGTSPTKKEDVQLLKKYRIKNILGLCSEKEAKWHNNLKNDFSCQRIVLPDSNQNRIPTDIEIKNAYSILREFINKDITFIHCFAAIERSPLLCILLIMEEYNLGIEESLDYVKRVHKSTNPRNSQLLLIQNFNFKNI